LAIHRPFAFLHTAREVKEMTVLVVEDNSRMRRLIRRLVEGLGAEVYECGDGDQVLAAYSEHRPDWVLMDIELVRVDGLTATRQLLAAWPEARVVMVTGHDDQLLREEARQAGACGYILKENLMEVRRLLLPHQL